MEDRRSILPLKIVFFCGFLLCVSFAAAVLTGRSNNIPSIETLLNPNTASLEQMSQLPSIGVKKAQAIIDYRCSRLEAGEQEPFKTAQDLENVKGIGKKTVEKIEEYLCFTDN